MTAIAQGVPAKAAGRASSSLQGINRGVWPPLGNFGAILADKARQTESSTHPHPETRSAAIRQASEITAKLGLNPSQSWGILSTAEDLSLFGLDFTALAGDGGKLAASLKTEADTMLAGLNKRDDLSINEKTIQRNQINGALSRLLSGLNANRPLMLLPAPRDGNNQATPSGSGDQSANETIPPVNDDLKTVIDNLIRGLREQASAMQLRLLNPNAPMPALSFQPLSQDDMAALLNRKSASYSSYTPRSGTLQSFGVTASASFAAFSLPEAANFNMTAQASFFGFTGILSSNAPSLAKVDVDGVAIDVTAILSLGMVLTDPLVLDMDGDGFDFRSSGDGVDYDLDGSGVKRTGFVQGDDALLYFDRDGNGLVSNAGELFGASGQFANGFAELAQYDDNDDGVIDEKDAIYSQLHTWQDKNGDGVCSADEVKSLAEAGIASINLGYSQTRVDDGKGNIISQTGSFQRTDGTTGTAADVWFAKQ